MPDRKQQPASSPMGCSLFSRILKSGTGCERSPSFGKQQSTSSCVTSHRPSLLLVELSLPSRFAALLLTEGRLFHWDLTRPIAITPFSPIQIASISAARRDAFSPLDSDLTSASAPPWPTSKPPSFSTRSRLVIRNCN